MVRELLTPAKVTGEPILAEPSLPGRARHDPPQPVGLGGGFRSLFGELQSNPADQAGLDACKSDLPFTPGSGGGYGSGG